MTKGAETVKINRVEATVVTMIGKGGGKVTQREVKVAEHSRPEEE